MSRAKRLAVESWCLNYKTRLSADTTELYMINNILTQNCQLNGKLRWRRITSSTHGFSLMQLLITALQYAHI
jgi:hypothetical protein